jgi:DNA-binding MarR family transcriptional regulator
VRAKTGASDGGEGSGWELGDVLEFMRRLWAVDHALQTRSKQMQGALGVTGPQRLVIRILGRFPGIPAGELARILHMHPSTLTGILERLQRHGAIRRRPDPLDRRRSLLGLTARGRELDARTSGTVEAAVRSVFSRLPRRKIQVTGEVLAALAHALQPVPDEPGA